MLLAVVTILFPAQAGVIPTVSQIKPQSQTVPRASGGDPLGKNVKAEGVAWSPRKRG